MRLLLSLLLLAPAASAQGLLAGAAEVVITPVVGAPMAGYYNNRGATGTHDDLYAKSIAIDLNGVRIAMVACDLVGLPREYSEEARRIIQQKTGLAPDHVMISATHSHTGPVLLTPTSRYNLPPDMDRIAKDYGAALPAKIAESAIRAIHALQPARIRSTIGREDSLAFNRRYFMKDGTVAWNPPRLDPNILKPAGPTDPAVPLIYIETLKGEPIAAYVNYALHQDTTGGMQFSADYAYMLAKVLRDAKGPHLVTVFTIGCAGNVNHFDVTFPEKQQGYEEASRIGAVLAAAVLKAIQHAPVIDIPSIRVSSEIVKLPTPQITAQEAEWARKTAATFGQSNAAPFLDLVRAGRDMDLLPLHGGPLDAEVQAIALGDKLAFVGLPGEIFVELGLTLKQDSPYANTIIAELADGSIGYVPNRQAYQEGQYEVVSSHCAPGGGELLMASALRQLFDLFHSR